LQIVILNWPGGENDPFTYFSNCLAKKIESVGKIPVIINLDENFDKKFAPIINNGIDFALTWQGLGSQININGSNNPIWEDISIPLICLHGDHPSHNPANHNVNSSWILNLYDTPSNSRYANNFLSQINPAYFLIVPNFIKGNTKPPIKFIGDYFILPKNHDDTKLLLDVWRNKFTSKIFKQLENIAKAIEEEIRGKNTNDHHLIIDLHLTESLLSNLIDHFEKNDERIVRHDIHGLMDKYYRNVLSEHVLNELHDVKLKIYGRGWERFKSANNPNHEFLNFDKVAEADYQYSSNYGIIDVTPACDKLHDRTYRAMANQSSFLSGTSWNSQHYLGEDFSKLFFSGRKNDLREKAEIVIQNPSDHLNNSRKFESLFDQKFNFDAYWKQIEMFARTMSK
jgi:hypothetical protein